MIDKETPRWIEDPVVDEIRITNWITETLQSPNSVKFYPTYAHYSWDGTSPLCHFVKPFIAEIKLTDGGGIIRITINPVMLSDKGSVPDFIPDDIADDGGWLWQLVAYFIHDAGYSSNYYTRKFWDKLLKQLLLKGGVDKWEAFRIYWGVRLGGWVSYEKPAHVVESVRRAGVLLEVIDRFTLSLVDIKRVLYLT